jgi:hypothetical protein
MSFHLDLDFEHQKLSQKRSSFESSTWSPIHQYFTAWDLPLTFQPGLTENELTSRFMPSANRTGRQTSI